MKRGTTVLTILFITAIALFGQYDPKENFYDGEFFFAEEDYAEALYAFTQVYKEGYQNNANINYRIGICLLNIDGRETEAIPYLETATSNITEKYREGNFKESAAPVDAYLYLGNAYRIDNQFDKAIENYNIFLESEGAQIYQGRYVDLQIEACNEAKKLMSEEAQYEVGNLGQINAIRAPVYNPAVSGDLNTVAFMGRQKFYNGVYISRKEDGVWTKPYNITPSIQSDGNQTVLALSTDGNQLLLSWADQFTSDIWITEYKNNRWYNSEPLPRPINSKYYESHACFTPDGNTIYFSSNRKESVGQMDIFRATKQDDGTWGELEVLGDHINTILNEETPYVSPDGKRLYFSSQGHPGLGGFDIYYCDIQSDGSLTAPKNLGYPLNTTDDDFAFSPKELEFDSFLTMYSKGDENQVDLYRFNWIPEDQQAVAMDFTRETIIVDPLFAPEETMAEEVAEEAVEAAEEVVEVVKESVEEVVETSEEVKEEVEEVVEEVIEETPPPAELTEKYLIKPVFFGFDSDVLSGQAKDKLDNIAMVLNKIDAIKLEVIGYTDAKGPDAYNIALSERRAKAVAAYLKSKGVAANRLTTVAKGESDPVAINNTMDNADSPQGRALNRRVQFRVTFAGSAMIEIDKINVPDELKIK